MRKLISSWPLRKTKAEGDSLRNTNGSGSQTQSYCAP